MNETRVSVELQQRLLFRRPEEFQFPWAGEPLPGWAWWPVTAMALLLGLLVAIALTFRDYGMSWDEPVQQTYGDDLLDFYGSGGAHREALAGLLRQAADDAGGAERPRRRDVLRSRDRDGLRPRHEVGRYV